MEASSSTLMRAVMLSSETFAMACNGNAALMLTSSQKGSAMSLSSSGGAAGGGGGGRIPNQEGYYDSRIMLKASQLPQSTSRSSFLSQSLRCHVSSSSSFSSSSSCSSSSCSCSWSCSSAGERDAPFRNISNIHLLPRRTRDCSLTRSCYCLSQSRDRLAAGSRRSGSAVHVAAPQVSLLLRRSRRSFSSSFSSFSSFSSSFSSSSSSCCFALCKNLDPERWVSDGDGGVIGIPTSTTAGAVSSLWKEEEEEVGIPTQMEIDERRGGAKGSKSGIPAAAAAAAAGGGGGCFAVRAVLPQLERGGLCRGRDRHRRDRDREQAILQRGRRCLKKRRLGKWCRPLGATMDFVTKEEDDGVAIANDDSSGWADDGAAIANNEAFVFTNIPRPQWLENWKPPSYLWRALAAFVVAGQVLIRILRGRVHVRNTLQQLEEVGPKSVGVSLLTASFVGMVFTIQFIREFARLGLTRSVGGVLALALGRELSPVVTAIILAGRVGSAFAAELGTMQEVDIRSCYAAWTLGRLRLDVGIDAGTALARRWLCAGTVDDDYAGCDGMLARSALCGRHY
ncbi:hypothetical protein CBR_g4089 [Chara braunii]|uniref:Uncharacterized protein n=1 Tax=Chara braunii TaxID=69332 RepID=A0A388KH94_CHABU|nr:hypothetical protein CBR_g4089 [Chara braunii]|eukprot:GBG69396.1 hypothetical protein CBR_g4089 [Chara braunii]